MDLDFGSDSEWSTSGYESLASRIQSPVEIIPPPPPPRPPARVKRQSIIINPTEPTVCKNMCDSLLMI